MYKAFEHFKNVVKGRITALMTGGEFSGEVMKIDF